MAYNSTAEAFALYTNHPGRMITMGNGSPKAQYLVRVNTVREDVSDDLLFLGIAIRLYRGLASAGRTVTMKLGVLKLKIVSIMLAKGLDKFVSKRTEAKLIYELKLPDGDDGKNLGGDLLRLMYKHGVMDELTKEDVQHLVVSKLVVVRKNELTDKCKKIIRGHPELWQETRELLSLKPKLEVSAATKKTQAGN